jgi:transcriptional regulator with XRE-family HTH domain
MLPIELQTPRDITRNLARRVKALRLERGWTQQEVAERAGLALATYRIFERSGRISLDRLLKLAIIFDARSGFEQLFAPKAIRSLAELEQRVERPSRKRGKRSDAQTRSTAGLGG